MKLLHRLFAAAANTTAAENDGNNEDPKQTAKGAKGATRASVLYSVTFEADRKSWRSQLIGKRKEENKTGDEPGKVSFFARAGDHCLPLEAGWQDIDLAKGNTRKSISGEEIPSPLASDDTNTCSQHELVESTSTTKTTYDWNLDDSEDDWILVETTAQKRRELDNNVNMVEKHHRHQSDAHQVARSASRSLQHTNNQMALDKTDIDLIKTSWVPVREDMALSGLLLFKELFTKFPQYKDFFLQFDNLNLERMKEHIRLQRHALKVTETVTYVVDSIGDESKANELSEALTNLVKSHLIRQVGVSEFRNLGIVLIDFICDINRRGAKLDTNLLVTAWTKLYSIILDLVRQEAGNAEE